VKPGVVVIPVSDVDTGTAFYAGPRSRPDADVLTDGDLRVVEITLPGSPCSIVFGEGVTPAAPGSAHGLDLIVSHEARFGQDWRGRQAAYTVHEQAGEELP
jgi:hypothetical protein